MTLWRNKWDPDGHEESIKQFKLLLQDASFVHQSGFSKDTWKTVIEARTNRHVADYSPYRVQRESPLGTVEITGKNWTDAARFNYKLAEEILMGAYKVVGL